MSGIVALLVALLGGTYRQICRFMLANTFGLPMVDKSGREVVSYLGTYNRSWLSLTHRVLTNLIVTVASVWAAGIAAAWVYPPTRGALSASFVGVFVSVLGLRLILSAPLVRIVNPARLYENPWGGEGGEGKGQEKLPAKKTDAGPPCPYCGQALRTAFAKQCRHCGMDWHDSENVICRKGSTS